jgi:hypothetical protein
MRPKLLKIISFTILVLVIVMALLIIPQLELPAPTGPYVVGERLFRWIDPSRPEVLTDAPEDMREVVTLIWYPAEPGTGTNAGYFPGLSTVSQALSESGEVSPLEVFGLQFIRSKILLNADVSKSDIPYPVVILSPGNGTNIEFYASLASEIASHGYIVVGLNHPYDVPAVELSNGDIAAYDKSQWLLEPKAHAAYTFERINVRTADVLFVLDQLKELNSNADNPFAGMLNLDAIAVAGHSLGGITAAQACKADARLRGCINFDGVQSGGPFSMEESAIPPAQPFMFLTKESQLHPKFIESFESTSQSYWIVIHGAAHDSFTDGPLLQPSLLPFLDRAGQNMMLIQKYTLAFLDQTLKGEPSDLLSESVHLQDVSVEVYPSN